MNELMDIWSIIEVIKEWQTLVAGILALIAAYATIITIRHQIDLQTEQFDDTQERKRWAARARIPGSLSEICSYTSSAASNIISETATHPIEPADAVETLINSMSYQEKNAASRIATLVEHFQIYTARLDSYFHPESNRIIGESQTSEMLYETALLQAYANSLFEYGRRESDIGPIEKSTCDEILTGLTNAIGLTNIDWEDPVYLGAVEIINRRHSEQSADE